MTDRETYGSSGSDGGGRAREGVADAATTVRAEVAHFASAAGEKAQEKVAEGQKVVGDGLGQFADALRQAAGNLEGGDQRVVAGLVKQAAEGLESVSRVVADKQPEEMLRAARDFGRQNPGVFFAASILAGVALGRLARASGERVQDGVADGAASPVEAPKVFGATEAAGGGLASESMAGAEAFSTMDNPEEVEGPYPRPDADDERGI